MSQKVLRCIFNTNKIYMLFLQHTSLYGSSLHHTTLVDHYVSWLFSQISLKNDRF